MNIAFEAALLFLSSHMIIDTPGQIEIFTWSASGTIITDAVAATFPAVVAYVIDTPRTVSPATFMSNMLYACWYGSRNLPSMLYSNSHSAFSTKQSFLSSSSLTKQMSLLTISLLNGCMTSRRSRPLSHRMTKGEMAMVNRHT